MTAKSPHAVHDVVDLFCLLPEVGGALVFSISLPMQAAPYLWSSLLLFSVPSQVLIESFSDRETSTANIIQVVNELCIMMFSILFFFSILKRA